MKTSTLPERICAGMLAGLLCGITITAQAAPITLNFWDMQWGVADYAIAAQKLVDRYNKEHPDVQVVYRSVPWTNWFTTYETAVASGSAADQASEGNFRVPEVVV